MGNQNIIQTENLSIGYVSKGKNDAIASGINLNFGKAKLISLIGANGIGKSTLLRTITGIQKPLSGAIFMNGRNVMDYSTLEIAQLLSVVLTEKLPPSNLTVFELVALGRQPYTNWIGSMTTEDFAKINDALELSQIKQLSSKKHYELSDGQLQRVLVARAFAQDTPLIILDEPTTHLDLLNKVSLFKLLKKMSVERGKCILFSTHDIDMAIQLSDEMVVMTREKTLQDRPENLIANGAFDSLFDNDDIAFDASKSKFVFKNF